MDDRLDRLDTLIDHDIQEAFARALNGSAHPGPDGPAAGFRDVAAKLREALDLADQLARAGL